METLSQYLSVITRYLKRKAKGFNGYILGLSGGLDSAVVARLAQQAIGDRLLCVIIDIDSHAQDLEDARELCRVHGIKYLDINLSKEYHALIAIFAFAILGVFFFENGIYYNIINPNHFYLVNNFLLGAITYC